MLKMALRCNRLAQKLGLAADAVALLRVRRMRELLRMADALADVVIQRRHQRRRTRQTRGISIDLRSGA